ncbi:MAG TPA: YfcE family phosphodiesterase, partial [Methanosarcinales archaeon]|nr:YfcE family phosphodiesterase [Methanosarcinales archaeon]
KKLLPERIVFNVEDICIGVIHRGQLNMLDTIGLGYLAREMEVDVLIFGHLHTPILESIYDNILLVCPGSPTKPRMSLPCAIELIIDGKDISGKIITLGKSYCEYIKSLSENSD